MENDFMLTGVFMIALAAASASLQQEEGLASGQYRLMLERISSLEITLTTGQATYLPGERFCTTILIRNPAATPIRISDPFHARSSDYYQLPAGQGVGSADPATLVHNSGGGGAAHRKMISLGAGESIGADTCSPELFDRDTPPFTRKAAQGRAGEYVVVFRFENRSTTANYRVEEVDGIAALASLKREIYMHDPPRAATGVDEACRGVAAAAVRTATGTAIAVLHDADVCFIRTYGTRAPVLPGFFTRIAEVQERVSDLQIDVHKDADFTLSWTADGKRRNMPVRPPSSVLPAHVREKLGIGR